MKLEEIKTGDYVFYTERPHSNYADALVHIRNVDGVDMAHTVCVNCDGKYINEDVDENFGYDIPVSAYFDEKCWHPTGYKEEYGSPAAWMAENFPLARSGRCTQKIANCPQCGEEPLLFSVDCELLALIHCGVRCDSVEMWNRYAAAMELAMLRSKYAIECDTIGDEEQKELWDMLADANKRVLAVFK